MPEVQINALDGTSFASYAAAGDKNNAPGILFIHGAAGFDAGAQSACNALASLGYTVLCPFLFGPDKPVFLAPPEENAPTALAFASIYRGFDLGSAFRMLLASLAHLRKTSQGGVGTVGHCLGGTLAFLLAARSDVDLAVGYDCAGLESFLDELYDIRVPTLLHFGEKDVFVPARTRQRIIKKLAANSVIAAHLYPEAGHSFVSGLAEAQQRTQALLLEKLKV